MKKLITFSLMLILVAGGMAAADEYRWNAGLIIGGGNAGGDAMGGIGAEVTREFGDNLELGFTAYAQSEVDGAHKDASGHEYHLESGYSALLIKPKLRVNEWLEIGLPLETGNGLLQYRYTGEYREEVRWTEEILDRVNHSVYSAGIEPKLLLAGHGAVTIGFGYRGTGPLRTDLAESGELDGFWGRMGYSYRF
ncbi:MAG: Ail/Lom family outer membrane beta-barrel protein [Spirochaetaceae bacterium]|nr:Ail/Lom family outer membrane beta-barrel protein [Spirochaetaceae bacterium]MCF7949387.1 Ail/Lom family outer membrane beta-barrel protein [Spirochaetia bacterium]MCF7952153.1 Ail/Lom family outer membrane beta-barrel protein [Spirochaetaceae bacterium]